ncbi:hypothetical protein RRG08_054151 [Elysia crispata]|uniref:Talin N-terminal F0 domain-containing protein n=1 Tax=Elysia crispata TaxID=231223 RepID=A0AAE0Y7F8_9GAST|nr:hypothetical protein RRG08_054151 [Elysia crispata]
MATLWLKISVIDQNAIKTMQFESSTIVYDACRMIRDRIPEANPSNLDGIWRHAMTPWPSSACHPCRLPRKQVQAAVDISKFLRHKLPKSDFKCDENLRSNRTLTFRFFCSHVSRGHSKSVSSGHRYGRGPHTSEERLSALAKDMAAPTVTAQLLMDCRVKVDAGSVAMQTARTAVKRATEARVTLAQSLFSLSPSSCQDNAASTAVKRATEARVTLARSLLSLPPSSCQYSGQASN